MNKWKQQTRNVAHQQPLRHGPLVAVPSWHAEYCSEQESVECALLFTAALSIEWRALIESCREKASVLNTQHCASSTLKYALVPSFSVLQNSDHVLWKLGTLPVGLLTFYGLTKPIDRTWHNLGLGYNKRLNVSAFSSAAVLHWNGNLKPWLKIAIPAYRSFWTRFLDFSDPDLVKCGFA